MASTTRATSTSLRRSAGGSTYAPVVITVVALTETIPPDHTGHHPDRQAGEVRQSAATYEEARDRIFAELPEGWRVLNLRTV